MTDSAHVVGAPLPWQRSDWERLRARIVDQRLHHAVLLSGPAGIGKRLLGDLLVRSILCRNPDRGQACFCLALAKTGHGNGQLAG